MTLSVRLRRIGREVGALLLAASCAGCDRPGEFLCRDCAARLAPAPRTLRTPQGLPVTAALSFDGVAARCIRRLKEDGETLLGRPLGAALSAALSAAVPACPAGGAPELVVPVATSRAAFRRRGYRVPELLVRRAGLVPSRLLTADRPVADQRTLGRGDRQRNVRGSMRARTAGHGRRILLVDDVITTGATLDEAARALSEAGFRVVAAIALASTPRRAGSVGDTSPQGRDND